MIYYLFVNLNIVYIQNITNKRKKTNKNKKKRCLNKSKKISMLHGNVMQVKIIFNILLLILYIANSS